MIYLEYEAARKRYQEALNGVNRVLDEADELFSMTQPKGVKTDSERVSGGKQENVFEAYLIEKERRCIDQRLIEAKSLLEERKYILKLKEQELRTSKDVNDRIYKYKYLDGLKGWQVAKMIGYSKSQIYRILSMMGQEIKNATKCD